MGKYVKNDVEQLVGILEEFDLDSIDTAYELVGSNKERFLETSSEERLEAPVDGKKVFELYDMPDIERIIDENNLLPAYFMELGTVKQKAVAKLSYRGSATGFLISPSILLTNNHVFRSKNEAKNAKVKFNYQLLPNGDNAIVDEYRTNPDDLFYTNRSLDYTIVRLAKKCDYVHLPFREDGCLSTENIDDQLLKRMNTMSRNRLPSGFPHNIDFRPVKFCRNAGDRWGHINLSEEQSYARGQLVNVIQHPSGRKKEVALQKNEITHIYGDFLRYKTDTQRGSSGSPVFNNSWELVALHHAGGAKDSNGKFINNEGIRIDKIVVDLKKKFSGTEKGRELLSELGI